MTNRSEEIDGTGRQAGGRVEGMTNREVKRQVDSRRKGRGNDK